ncbi:MAG: hypothetical protein K9G48_13150 [Reyranella sp.]|nr:hypothetical protein [Reyranella sp.]
MTSNLITPNYLISYSRPASVDDYRPVVNSTGTAVIFERSPSSNPRSTNLYILDIAKPGGTPTLFLNGTSLPDVANRPDWSWKNGTVAFNCQSGKSAIEVGLVGANGTNPATLNDTSGMFYPAWFPTGAELAVENGGTNPTTSIISTSGSLILGDLEDGSVWAGMPSVNQKSPGTIAFAGQPAQSNPNYQQDFNYIWLATSIYIKDSYVLSPLEVGASSSSSYAPQFQGRAPWWSPDGKWVVFESNRASQPLSVTDGGLYSIFLYEPGGTNPAIQLTDPIYNMQHAKWLPFGFNGVEGSPTLVGAAYQPGSAGDPPSWPFGLATLDVSSLVQSS